MIEPHLLPSIIGPVGDPSVLRPGQSFRLCTLGSDGALLISKDLALVAVQRGLDGSTCLYEFRHSAPDVWTTVSSLWPGTTPGKRFERFHVIEEKNEYGFTPSFALLDLLLLDVLVRGPQSMTDDLCEAANRDAAQVLQRLAIADVTHALRMAEPRMAGAVTEQLRLSWHRRLRT